MGLSNRGPVNPSNAKYFGEMTWAELNANYPATEAPPYSTARVTDRGGILYYAYSGAWTSQFVLDGSGNITGVEGPGGEVTPLPGSSLTSGAWYQSPGIFKLILSGVGDVAVSAKNSAGVETLVDTITVNSVDGESAYPYLGDTAVQIKVDLTGTANARIF